jgi:hypothetical protein
MTTDATVVDEVFVPFAEGRSFIVRAGQTLRIEQPAGGGQVADVNVWNLDDPRERFWGSHTALYHGAHVTEGCELISTWPGERPIMTIVRDFAVDVGVDREPQQHDVLFGRCSQKYREARYGEATPGCQELLAQAIEPAGLTPDCVHDALNLFMATGIADGGELRIKVSPAREGDFVELRALIDCRVAISSCPGGCTAPGALGLACTIVSPERDPA